MRRFALVLFALALAAVIGAATGYGLRVAQRAKQPQQVAAGNAAPATPVPLTPAPVAAHSAPPPTIAPAPASPAPAVHSATALPAATARPAVTSTPAAVATTPVVTPAATPVVTPAATPVVTPIATPAPVASSSGPQIYSVDVPSEVHGGSSLTGIVTTSDDVTEVSAGAQGYNIPLTRNAPGRFSINFAIPPVPFFFHGNYTVTVTARTANGATTSRSFGVALK